MVNEWCVFHSFLSHSWIYTPCVLLCTWKTQWNKFVAKCWILQRNVSELSPLLFIGFRLYIPILITYRKMIIIDWLILHRAYLHRPLISHITNLVQQPGKWVWHAAPCCFTESSSQNSVLCTQLACSITVNLWNHDGRWMMRFPVLIHIVKHIQSKCTSLQKILHMTNSVKQICNWMLDSAESYFTELSTLNIPHWSWPLYSNTRLLSASFSTVFLHRDKYVTPSLESPPWAVKTPQPYWNNMVPERCIPHSVVSQSRAHGTSLFAVCLSLLNSTHLLKVDDSWIMGSPQCSFTQLCI